MSQGGRNPRGKRDGKFDLELAHVVVFLRFIAVMTGALFIVSTAAFFLGEHTPATDTVYGMTIFINLLAAVGSFLGAWRLDKKDKRLLEMEKEKKLVRPGEPAVQAVEGKVEGDK